MPSSCCPRNSRVQSKAETHRAAITSCHRFGVYLRSLSTPCYNPTGITIKYAGIYNSIQRSFAKGRKELEQVANHGRSFGHNEVGVAHAHSIHHCVPSGSSGGAAAYHQRAVVAVQRSEMCSSLPQHLQLQVITLPHVITYQKKSLIVLVAGLLSND